MDFHPWLLCSEFEREAAATWHQPTKHGTSSSMGCSSPCLLAIWMCLCRAGGRCTAWLICDSARIHNACVLTRHSCLDLCIHNTLIGDEMQLVFPCVRCFWNTYTPFALVCSDKPKREPHNHSSFILWSFLQCAWPWKHACVWLQCYSPGVSCCPGSVCRKPDGFGRLCVEFGATLTPWAVLVPFCFRVFCIWLKKCNKGWDFSKPQGSKCSDPFGLPREFGCLMSGAPFKIPFLRSAILENHVLSSTLSNVKTCSFVLMEWM